MEDVGSVSRITTFTATAEAVMQEIEWGVETGQEAVIIETFLSKLKIETLGALATVRIREGSLTGNIIGTAVAKGDVAATERSLYLLARTINPNLRKVVVTLQCSAGNAEAIAAAGAPTMTQVMIG